MPWVIGQNGQKIWKADVAKKEQERTDVQGTSPNQAGQKYVQTEGGVQRANDGVNARIASQGGLVGQGKKEQVSSTERNRIAALRNLVGQGQQMAAGYKGGAGQVRGQDVETKLKNLIPQMKGIDQTTKIDTMGTPNDPSDDSSLEAIFAGGVTPEEEKHLQRYFQEQIKSGRDIGSKEIKDYFDPNNPENLFNTRDFTAYKLATEQAQAGGAGKDISGLSGVRRLAAINALARAGRTGEIGAKQELSDIAEQTGAAKEELDASQSDYQERVRQTLRNMLGEEGSTLGGEYGAKAQPQYSDLVSRGKQYGTAETSLAKEQAKLAGLVSPEEEKVKQEFKANNPAYIQTYNENLRNLESSKDTIFGDLKKSFSTLNKSYDIGGGMTQRDTALNENVMYENLSQGLSKALGIHAGDSNISESVSDLMFNTLGIQNSNDLLTKEKNMRDQWTEFANQARTLASQGKWDESKIMWEKSDQAQRASYLAGIEARKISENNTKAMQDFINNPAELTKFIKSTSSKLTDRTFEPQIQQEVETKKQQYTTNKSTGETNVTALKAALKKLLSGGN